VDESYKLGKAEGKKEEGRPKGGSDPRRGKIGRSLLDKLDEKPHPRRGPKGREEALCRGIQDTKKET